MRSIITLVIVVAVLNATGRAGAAAWKYYQFKDATHEIALYGAMTPTAELHRQVMERAIRMDIPINADDISVRRDGRRTMIDASYVQTLELIPRYEQTFPLKFAVEGTYTGEEVEKMPN